MFMIVVFLLAWYEDPATPGHQPETTDKEAFFISLSNTEGLVIYENLSKQEHQALLSTYYISTVNNSQNVQISLFINFSQSRIFCSEN